jgi:hypothetical protein
LVARVLLMKDGIWGLLVRATGAEEKRAPAKFDFPAANEEVAQPNPGASR